MKLERKIELMSTLDEAAERGLDDREIHCLLAERHGVQVYIDHMREFLLELRQFAPAAADELLRSLDEAEARSRAED